MPSLLSFWLFLVSVQAFQFPLQFSLFSNAAQAANTETVLYAHNSSSFRVAVIGAGAGGSSAAFWLSTAKERLGLDIEVDIYERESYVGGRSTVVFPYGDNKLPPLELGASIFVSANRNLWRATDAFNLTRGDDSEEDDLTSGLWDGQKMLLTWGGKGLLTQWWGQLKIILRYGVSSPKKANDLVSGMIDHFLTLYTTVQRWSSISDLSKALGYESYTVEAAAEYYDSQGISPKFYRELIEGATRVNYAQDIDQIDALGGLVSMAANGATSVSGGNFQIFEKFIQASKAALHLNTTVTSVLPVTDGRKGWVLSTSQGQAAYDAVILAAPYQFAALVVPPSIRDVIVPAPYIHLFVTLFTTTSKSPKRPEFQQTQTILTTADGHRRGGPAPEFNSISYHGETKPGVYTVKIFSLHQVEDSWLNANFDGVDWIYRKEWDSYPRLLPTDKFSPLALADNFYYVNAFEPFISTMETETIASRGVVDALLDANFNTTLCGPNYNKQRSDSDYIYGWDC